MLRKEVKMSNVLIQQMNDIIKNWKTAYVWRLSDVFVDEHIKKEELESKSWADIMRTSYELFANRKTDEILEPRAAALRANGLVIDVAKRLQGFYSNPDVSAFYKKTFGPARNVALSLMQEQIMVDDAEPYAVLPSGTPWNNGKPMGLQNITPCLLELTVVSDNPDAHKVNDILLCEPIYSVIIRAVPKLPRTMLDWAAKNNVNVK